MYVSGFLEILGPTVSARESSLQDQNGTEPATAVTRHATSAGRDL